MARWGKNSPIVRMVVFVLLTVLLSACRVVEKPAQTAYPALSPARRATAQPTRPPATKSSGQATARPTRLPATKKPVQATVAPSPSPMPSPTRDDVAFSLTILYTGEVHGEVRPCG